MLPFQTIHNSIPTPSELRCQRAQLSQMSGPVGLATIWSSLLASSDGQKLSRMPSAQKHIRSRHK